MHEVSSVADPFEDGKCYKAKCNILKFVRLSAVWAPDPGATMSYALGQMPPTRQHSGLVPM